MTLKIRNDAYRRILDLSDEMVADIDQKLIGGATIVAVATYMRDELKVCTDIKFGSLERTLERYRTNYLRKKVVNALQNKHFGGRESNTRGPSTSVLQRNLNAMEEMDALAKIQKTRFEKMLMKEENAPMLLKSVSNEIVLYRNLLVDLGKLQLETGVLVRAPKRIQGTITDPNGEVSNIEWTEEQDALFKELGEKLNHEVEDA